MEEEKKPLLDLIGNVKRIRDELKVQIHLGKSEAKDEWDQLEKKWEELKSKRKPVTDAAGKTAENVNTAVKLVAEELMNGYDRIKKLIK